MTTTIREAALAGRAMPFPIYDIHGHCGEFLGLTGPSMELTLAEMDRVGVRRMLISSIHALYGDIVGGNDEVARVCAAHPDRFWGYAHVSAQHPEHMVHELERCFEQPCFRGIKVYQVGTDFDDPLFDEVWAFAEARGLPVLAHTWGGNLTGFDRVAARHPGATFLAGHSGSGFAWKPYVDAARMASNLFLDLTCSREYTHLIEIFVREVGSERVVWGTDMPTFSIAQQAGKVLLADISDDAKRDILSINAQRLFPCENGV